MRRRAGPLQGELENCFIRLTLGIYIYILFFSESVSI